jgi:hypothetical protein
MGSALDSEDISDIMMITTRFLMSLLRKYGWIFLPNQSFYMDTVWAAIYAAPMF